VVHAGLSISSTSPLYSINSYPTQNEDPTEHDVTDPALWDLLPLEILAQAGSFPLALVLPPHVQSPGEHLRMLYELLPAEDEALRLRDCAFQYGFFL
jgi:hypothetical protein